MYSRWLVCFGMQSGNVTRFFCIFLLQESNPPEPLIKTLKWFCWQIHFCKDIQIFSLKNSTPQVLVRAGNLLICSSLIRSFVHFAEIKWGTVSDFLRLLKTNERPWANHSGCSRFAHSFFFGERCEWIAQVAHQK